MSDQKDARLDALFDRLGAAESPQEGAVIEDEIWALWTSRGEEFVDSHMAYGIRAMNARDLPAARAAFEAVVKAAPDFAEGYNKRATVHWLMGNYAASIADIDRTLELEPRHFGALSGLALIRAAQGKPFHAIEALEKVMRIHPQMPLLQERIDQLTREFGESV